MESSNAYKTEICTGYFFQIVYHSSPNLSESDDTEWVELARWGPVTKGAALSSLDSRFGKSYGEWELRQNGTK